MNAATSETTALVVAAAERLFGDLVTPELIAAVEAGQFPDTLWQALVDGGFTALSVPAVAGGSGLDLAARLAFMRSAGRFAVPLPLLEHEAALALLAEVGLPLPEGLVALAFAAFEATPAGIAATVEAVPFARHARHLLLLHGEVQPAPFVLVTMADARVSVTPATGLAGEPRDRVELRGVSGPGGTAADPDGLLRGLALGRAAQMNGALERVLELAVSYALERSQFGRPIAKFQAIQQQLAVLAGEVAAAVRAVDAAAERGAEGLGVWGPLAKARLGDAVGPVTEIAHQVHGAMGFTHEHLLHRYTRRLWAWRDEHGSEFHWQAELGARILAGGAAGLWPFITDA
jgi:acyl-CoA dehydrogenase